MKNRFTNRITSFVALILISTLALQGCVSDYKLAPKDPAQVEVLNGRPLRDYFVVADFQTGGASERSLRRSAAEIGADAVIISNFGSNYSTKATAPGKDPYASPGGRVLGTAIKYK